MEARESLLESAFRVGEVTATERVQSLRQRLEGRRMRAMTFLAAARPVCIGVANGSADLSPCRETLETWQVIEGFAAAALTREEGAPVLLGPGANSLLQAPELASGQIARFSRSGGRASYLVRVEDAGEGATLTLRFDDLGGIEEMFDDSPALGEGGETFLADERGFFLTAPRYPGAHGHEHPISAAPMRRCLGGERGVTLAQDYHGADVIHAFEHVEFIGGGCVMAHVQQDVAFAPASVLGRRIAGMGVGFAILAIVVSLLLARRITRPISRLADAARTLERGELNHPVPTEGPREIQAFAHAFTSMTTSLRERTDALEEANRSKSEFLSAMSHELRTPLNAIAGYAELMGMGIHGPVTAAQANALERIKRSQEYLLRLINDILNFARLEAGRVEFDITDVPLAEVLTGLDALIEPLIRARGVEFHFSCESTLEARADRDKLEQVILNLLTNAAKFTEPGGRVELSCEVDAAAVKIMVADTGRGMPAEKLATIFDPFTQVDRQRTEASQQGVGLGLAISRDLARGMGGDLTVESRLGEGSTFIVTLPPTDAVAV